MSQIGKSKICKSIKVNKDIIKARQVEACPELGTAKPKLVFTFITTLPNYADGIIIPPMNIIF